MKKCYKFKLKKIGNEDIGYLVPLELSDETPFEVKRILSNGCIGSGSDNISLATWAKRIFYTYDVANGASRGEHAYHKTEQVIICVAGSLKIRCSYNDDEEIYELNKPTDALYIPPHIWRATFDHSPDSVLLVLSSLEYDESDYIRCPGV